MSKINKSDSNNNGTYIFSFSLKNTNPFEKVILDKLNQLIEKGYSKKDAIMTLMSGNLMMDNFSDAPVVESVQSKKENVTQNKIIKDSDTKTVKEINPVKQAKVIAEEINQNHQQEVKQQVENKSTLVKPSNNENTFEDKDKEDLRQLLQGMYD